MKAIMLAVAVAFAGAACSSPPVEVAIKDACAQKKGANVILTGFISLPREMETTKYTRGGQGAGITYKLYLMSKADASGDAVGALFSGTGIGERNKVKSFPPNYTWNDLLAYTDDGREIGPGKPVKVTGEIAEDEKEGCRVNVRKIEQP